MTISYPQLPDCRKHFTKLCILIKPQDIKCIEWQSQRYRIRHGFSHLLLISYKPLCFLSLPCFPPPSSLKHISKLCTRKSADLNSESLGTNQMVQCLQTFKWVLAPKEKKKSSYAYFKYFLTIKIIGSLLANWIFCETCLHVSFWTLILLSLHESTSQLSI